MIGILQTILNIKSDAQVTLLGGDIDRLIWTDGNPTNITKEQILAKQSELQEAEDAAVAQKATDKVNAKAKLIAGESLTEAEADALTG